ncbi:MAG: uncharacterized protein JWR62_1106 [Modestobacter sp.]|jgi:hypothetical protein|nr:uncharacterized protein [Modestobacter sp.]
MRLVKLLGVAGLAGVAATGAVLTRHERHRRAYTPDDIRLRLQARIGNVDLPTSVTAAKVDADPDMAPRWPATEEPPRRDPVEMLLSGGMWVVRKVRPSAFPGV